MRRGHLNIKRFLLSKNQERGTVLLQTILIAGIIGGLGYIVTKMRVDLKKQSLTEEVRQDSQELRSLIEAVFDNPSSCNQALDDFIEGTVGANTNIIGQPAAVYNFTNLAIPKLDGGGNPIVIGDGSNANGETIGKVMIADDGSGITIPIGGVVNYAYSSITGGVTEDDFALITINVTNVTLTTNQVAGANDNRRVFGQPAQPFTLQVIVRKKSDNPNPGRYEGCMGIFKGDGNEELENQCNSMGGTWTTAGAQSFCIPV